MYSIRLHAQSILGRDSGDESVSRTHAAKSRIDRQYILLPESPLGSNREGLEPRDRLFYRAQVLHEELE